MFDLAWAEMAMVAAVAVIIIGPKELPRVLRIVGQSVRRLRRMASEFQNSVDEMVRDSEIDDLRNQVEGASAEPLGQQFSNSIDPTAATGDKPKDKPADWSAPASEPAIVTAKTSTVEEAPASSGAKPAGG